MSGIRLANFRGPEPSQYITVQLVLGFMVWDCRGSVGAYDRAGTGIRLVDYLETLMLVRSCVLCAINPASQRADPADKT